MRLTRQALGVLSRKRHDLGPVLDVPYRLLHVVFESFSRCPCILHEHLVVYSLEVSHDQLDGPLVVCDYFMCLGPVLILESLAFCSTALFEQM